MLWVTLTGRPVIKFALSMQKFPAQLSPTLRVVFNLVEIAIFLPTLFNGEQANFAEISQLN